MATNNERIERKVQLTGGSTYTVSLPKEWAQEYDIEPGETVDLYTRGETLVLRRSVDGDRQTRVEITLTGGDKATVSRRIEAAYVSGADEIRLSGFAGTDERRAATDAIRQFIGLEVLSEDEHTLTARTMLDAADLSAHRSIEQIRRSTLEMHEDALRAVCEADDALGERIAQQDETVDRLFALLSREFQRSLVDPDVALQRDGLSAFEYYMAGRQLERVADHAEKIAVTAAALEEPPRPEITDALEEYGQRARAMLTESLDGLLEDGASLLTVVSDGEELLAELAAFDETIHESAAAESYRLGIVLDSLVRTVRYSLNIAEAGLQAEYRR